MRYGEMVDLINCMSIYEGRAESKPRRRKMTFDEAIAMR